MDILCSDKTGTLTLNKLTVDVANVYPVGEHTIEDVSAPCRCFLLLFLLLCLCSPPQG